MVGTRESVLCSAFRFSIELYTPLTDTPLNTIVQNKINEMLFFLISKNHNYHLSGYRLPQTF